MIGLSLSLFIFVSLVMAIIVRVIIRFSDQDLDRDLDRDREWEHFEQKDRGVRDDCVIAEEDIRMKLLHKNMWMRDSTKVNDVASYTAKIIGNEMNEDTEKAQRIGMTNAKKLALSG